MFVPEAGARTDVSVGVWIVWCIVSVVFAASTKCTDIRPCVQL